MATGEEAIPHIRGGRKEQGEPGAGRAAEMATRAHEAGGDEDPGSPAAAVNLGAGEAWRRLPTAIVFLGSKGVKIRKTRTVVAWHGPGWRPGVRTSSPAPLPAAPFTSPQGDPLRFTLPAQGGETRGGKREELSLGFRVSKAWNPEEKDGSGCNHASLDGWRVRPSTRAGRFGDRGAERAAGALAPRAPTRGVFPRGVLPFH